MSISITTIADAPFILRLFNTPDWLQYIGDRDVNSVQSAEQYISSKMIPQYERLGYSNYTITEKESQKKVGVVGLYDRDGIEGVDIGFAFLPEFQKHGFGFESSIEMMRIGFEKIGVEKISGITIEENIGSQKLMEKLGMTFRKMMRIEGDEAELMLYVIERIEWNPS